MLLLYRSVMLRNMKQLLKLLRESVLNVIIIAADNTH